MYPTGNQQGVHQRIRRWAGGSQYNKRGAPPPKKGWWKTLDHPCDNSAKEQYRRQPQGKTTMAGMASRSNGAVTSTAQETDNHQRDNTRGNIRQPYGMRKRYSVGATACVSLRKESSQSSSTGGVTEAHSAHGKVISSQVDGHTCFWNHGPNHREGGRHHP